MGWVGGRLRREEIYVYKQLIHFIVQQKLTQHYKEAITVLKKKKQPSYLKTKQNGRGRQGRI